jgi:hypothetical protein
VNYELHAAQSGNQSFPDQSVLVVIPHDQAAAGAADDWQLTGGRAPSDVQQSLHPAPPAAGDSVLRSIGDR